jgi:hypothetical protein
MNGDESIPEVGLDRLLAAAELVAEWSAQDVGNEIFLGYFLKKLETSDGSQVDGPLPLDETVILSLEHWSAYERLIIEVPNVVHRRTGAWTLKVSDLLDYKPEWCPGISDPSGDFEIFEFDEPVTVSSDDVPAKIVDALILYLNSKMVEIVEVFHEKYELGNLPNFDPRIRRVVSYACEEFGWSA